jgi:hypothetical protein
MRRLAASSLVLLSVVLAASATGAPRRQASTVLDLHGALHGLAIDGSRAVLGIRPRAGCDRVVVWDVRTDTTTTVSGAKTCAIPRTSTGSGVREVAIAGARVAWIADLGGNTEHADFLFTASALRASEVQLDHAALSGETQPEGALIRDLVGHGSVLVYQTARLGQNGDGHYGVLASALHRIGGPGHGPTQTTTIAPTKGQYGALGTDGTLLLFWGGGDVVTTNLRGVPVGSISPGGLAKGNVYAIDAGRVALVTRAPALELYAARTPPANGTPTQPLVSVRLPAGGEVTRTDLSGRLALVVTYRTVRIVDVTTGRVATLVAAGRRITDAALEPAGAIYVAAGKATFVPYAQLLARVVLAH